MVTVRGIDVSAWQHPAGEAIDWHQVELAGYRRVWIKATEGLDYVNEYCAMDAHGARAAGIANGFYHVLDPAQSAAAQAEATMKAIESLPRDFGVAVDLEPTYGTDWSLWEQSARAYLGALPESVERKWVYCDTWFRQNMPGAPWGYELWLAQWDSRPRIDVGCWQSSSDSEVPGVPSTVDVDWWFWGSIGRR